MTGCTCIFLVAVSYALVGVLTRKMQAIHYAVVLFYGSLFATIAIFIMLCGEAIMKKGNGPYFHYLLVPTWPCCPLQLFQHGCSIFEHNCDVKWKKRFCFSFYLRRLDLCFLGRHFHFPSKFHLVRMFGLCWAFGCYFSLGSWTNILQEVSYLT